MIRHAATPAIDEIYVLAEGPIWDPVRNRVLWVDINGSHVLTGELQGARIVETGRQTFPETIGAVVCSEAGDLLIAGATTVFRNQAGTDAVRLLPAGAGSRLNDGGCDPAGRFLVGSLALDDRKNEEKLFRIEPSGEVTVIDEQLGLSNGLAWSPDGSLFYSTDTTAGLIWVRSYDSDSGHYGERREHLRITGGHPDGMCADAEGNLWVAIWGAGEVRCYTPTGEVIAVVEVAAPNTSSVAFIGPQLDTLLITTASEQLSAAQIAEYPDSGRLFTASVGVTGLPVPYWAGS